MRILFLTFYFRPDLSAGSFRATALVAALREVVPPGSQIDVITTLPNRYHSFTADAALNEEHDGMWISRIALPKHRGGMLDQSKSFIAYFRDVLRRTAEREYDIVFVTSGRLMSAVLGALISRRKDAKLYVDIRDIFVDAIKDVFPRKVSWVIAPIFSVLEKWAIERADKVNLVSLGFAEYFSERYPHQQYSYFTNGIDDEFVAAAPTKSSPSYNSDKNLPLSVVYAGNLGEGQGLHSIIPDLAKIMGHRVRFKIVGDGARKRALETSLAELGVSNVELLSPVNRVALLETYRAADVLFLHLNNYEALKKVLPSKLFEYAALGKPVWAGVTGYAAKFVTSEISNSAVFHPCDVAGAVRAFETLEIRDTPRRDFIEKYARPKISMDMAKDILGVARSL